MSAKSNTEQNFLVRYYRTVRNFAVLMRGQILDQIRGKREKGSIVLAIKQNK